MLPHAGLQLPHVGLQLPYAGLQLPRADLLDEGAEVLDPAHRLRPRALEWVSAMQVIGGRRAWG